MTSTTPTAGSPRTAGARGVGHPGTMVMLGGGVLGVLGSFFPWLMTPMGTLSGMAGAGLWTLSAGMLAIAGALLPFRRVALVHAAVGGLVMAGLVVWQLGRIGQISIATGSWGQLLPGMGLVMVGGAAVLLLHAARRLRTTG